MATETKYTNSASVLDKSGGLGWGPAANFIGSDRGTWAGCFGLNTGLHSDYLRGHYSAFTITGAIGKVEADLTGKDVVTFTSYDMYIEFYNSTDGWCAGHEIGEWASTTDVLKNIECAHWAWTDTKIDSLDIRVYVENVIATGSSTVSCSTCMITVTTASLPSAPADPTIIADGVGDLTVSSDNPSDGGAPLDNVEHQISTSPTFSSGNITWTKNSAPTDPQTNQFAGLGNGAGPYYARARYHNDVGWGDYNSSPYNSATTWDVPTVPQTVGADLQ